MTWSKYGTEYFDQLVDMDLPEDLDDACQLTYTQAIHYCYSVENMSLRFKGSVLRRFATSPKAEDAAHALVNARAWAARGSEFELIHHADVIRQSIAAQQTKRAKEKDRQRRKRAVDAGSDVGTNIDTNVGATQTDRHTDRQRPEAPPRFTESDGLAEHIDMETGEIRQAWPPPPSAPMTCAAPGCTEQLNTAQRRASRVCYTHHREREGYAS